MCGMGEEHRNPSLRVFCPWFLFNLQAGPKKVSIPLHLGGGWTLGSGGTGDRGPLLQHVSFAWVTHESAPGCKFRLGLAGLVRNQPPDGWRMADHLRICDPSHNLESGGGYELAPGVSRSSAADPLPLSLAATALRGRAELPKAGVLSRVESTRPRPWGRAGALAAPGAGARWHFEPGVRRLEPELWC